MNASHSTSIWVIPRKSTPQNVELITVMAHSQLKADNILKYDINDLKTKHK